MSRYALALNPMCTANIENLVIVAVANTPEVHIHPIPQP